VRTNERRKNERTNPDEGGKTQQRTERTGGSEEREKGRTRMRRTKREENRKKRRKRISIKEIEHFTGHVERGLVNQKALMGNEWMERGSGGGVKKDAAPGEVEKEEDDNQ
jgi:hypothetical protein